MTKNNVDIAMAWAVLFLSAGLFSCAGDEPATLYGSWGKNSYTWKDANGNSTTWVDGSIAEVTYMYGGTANPTTGATIAPYKLVFNVSYTPSFWTEGGGSVSIGAGGVEFKQAGLFSYGLKNKNAANSRVRLMADQTWRGPSSGTAYADAVIGSLYYYKDIYSLMPLYVDPAVREWTINGMLNVWITSYYNNLSNLHIRVESPARLYLPESYWLGGVQREPAQLKARKITLSGEGNQMLPIGASVPYVHPNALAADHPNVEMIAQLDTNRLARTLELSNGAGLAATVPATFDIPDWIVSGAGTSVVTGDFTFVSSVPSVTLADGATLHMAGRFNETSANSMFTATGSGVLALSESTEWNLSGGVSVDTGVTLAIRGLDRLDVPVHGTGSLHVEPGTGGMTYIPSETLSDWSGTHVTVDGGTLVLDEEPAGVVVETLNGGTVKYGDDAYVVTDAIRTESTINVPAGQTLHIFGNGLTAATSLVLNGGTNLYFHVSATVASPITCPAGATASSRCSVFLCAKYASVTGTLSGRVTGGASFCDIMNNSPGCIKFAGGGEMFESSYIAAYNGSLMFTAGEYVFGGTSVLSLNSFGAEAYSPDWGRYIGIRDGGTVTIRAGTSSSRVALRATPCKDGGGYKASSTIEVGVGGVLNVPDRSQIILGGRQNCGELLISGGSMTVGKDGGIYLGYNAWSTGTFRMTAGTFTTSSPFAMNDANSHSLVYLEGGVFKIGSGFNAEALMTGGLGGQDGVTRNFSVGILGDCMIDLSETTQSVITNMPTTSNRGEWYGEGTLIVKGGKTLYMRSMPNGLKIRLEGDGTRLAVDDETRVFDAAACTEYCTWRRPYIGGKADYYSSKDCGLEVEGNLSISMLQLTNGAPSFVNRSTTLTPVVSCIQVQPSGCWDNETTIVSGTCEMTNLMFQGDSVWRITRRGGDTAVREFPGGVSLPSTLYYQIMGNGDLPSGMPLIVSGTTIETDPIWMLLGAGSGRIRPKTSFDGNSLYLTSPGMWIRFK